MGGRQKKDYFTKNIPSPTFFEINTANFQEMFLEIFLKFCRLKKINKKTVFFGFFVIKF